MTSKDVLAELLGVTIPAECRKWAANAEQAQVSPRDLVGLEQMVRDARYLARMVERAAGAW